MSIVVKLRRTRDNAQTPVYASKGAAGLDLYAAIDQPVSVGRTPVKIPTGIILEIPPGYYGRIQDRSSLALKGFHTVAGIIDSDYRGEILVVMFFTGSEGSYGVIEPGQRLAQLVVERCEQVKLQEVEEVAETERGEGGFGSTGE